MSDFPQRLEPDELLDVDPEPCKFCDSGIEFMKCHDGAKRCLSCVREHARMMGWDVLLIRESVAAPETVNTEETVLKPETAVPDNRLELW